MSTDSTHRFDDRVQDYLLGRPGYPRQLLDVLRRHMGAPAPESLGDFRLDWVVADIGAGTGLLARPFLEAGCAVHAIEPSASMAEAARRVLAHFPNLEVHEARAEATGLPEASVDLVVVGQAFHWFDAAAAAEEWRRILRGPRVAAIVWNRRHLAGTAFAEAYETFLKSWSVDYEAVMERYESPEALRAVFKDVPEPEELPNRQRLGREGLLARLRSCSYLPGEDHPRREAMIRAANGLFDAHARGGVVELTYDTAIYAGPIRA